MPPMSDSLESVLQQFIRSSSQPAVIETGGQEIPLVSGSYSIETFGKDIRLHAWTEAQSYSRRIVGIRSQKPGRLDLHIIRFGRPNGILTILDLAYKRNQPIQLRGQREQQKEQFHRMLCRQFPEWTISLLSTAPDLEHSLSPVYPRALLQQGRTGIAAICAPENVSDVDGVLTFGLIWLHHLRQTQTKLTVGQLCLFVPENLSQNTALRMRYLDSEKASFALHLFHQTGEYPVDIQDWGNVETKLAFPVETQTTRKAPESELENLIQNSIRSLDAALDAQPVYRQSLSIAAGDRGILDLLAIDLQGRLAVIELKATEDIHLPLQALDYWMRILWHLERNSFTKLGYFSQKEILKKPPILYLVAPSLEFHSTMETVLNFFSREVPVIQLGLGANWRSGLKVISRQEKHEYSGSIKRSSGKTQSE